MSDQKQKPERFRRAPEAYRGADFAKLCALETISAQLDYLIEMFNQPPDGAIDSATHGDDGCVSHTRQEKDDE